MHSCLNTFSEGGESPMSGEFSAKLELAGETDHLAALLGAITPDDPDSFSGSIEANASGGALLVIEVHAPNMRTLRATLDDLLACLAAAEAGLTAATGE
jgi:hypothetical protein